MIEKSQKIIYKKEEVYTETLKYFGGDTLATDVWMNKYCLKDSDGNYYELSPDDMHKRMAKEFAKIEDGYSNKREGELSDYGKKRGELTEEKIFDYFKNFKYISPQGSIMSLLGNDNSIGSLSNCVVLPKLNDSYSGIMYADQQLAQLFKRRNGVGLELSTLRPRDSKVFNTAGTSTGAVSFMERFSNTTREVSQSGRRGALMISMDVRHPDIFEFVKIKRDLKKVTGANISIQLRDDFMEAVEKNEKYSLRFPVDSPIEDAQTIKEINARELWDEIIISAHGYAEPGLIFKDRQHKYSTSSIYPNWENISTNPCQPSWAKVLTPQGIRKLGDVNIGDKIWSSEGWTVITNKFSTGIKKVYKYSTPYNVFYGTEEHRILSNGEKVEVKDAKTIDTLKFTSYLWGYAWGVINHDKTKVSDGADFYRNMGDYDNIPDKYYYGDQKEIISFLRGVFDVGAVLNDDGIRIIFDTLNISEQIRALLSSFGIFSKITNMGGNYLLNLDTSSYIFYRTIGFSNTEKLETLKFIKRIISRKEFDPNDVSKYISPEITKTEFISEEEVFDITVDNISHTYWTEGCNVSNCSEIAMNDDSCRLMVVNYFSCVENPFTPFAKFNFDKLYEITYEAQRLIDDLVDLELLAIEKIFEKIKSDPEPDYIKSVEIKTWENLYNKGKNGRRTGLGFTGIGDVFAALGLKYDSDQAMEFLKKISETKFIGEFDSSIDMAIQRGKFKDFNPEHENKSEFVQMMKEEYPDLYNRMMKNGRRNISISTVAPTGSLSILTQTTSGIEPLYMIGYKRRKKVNPGEKDVRVDFVDDMGDSWTEFDVLHPRAKQWLNVNNIFDTSLVYSQSPYVGSTAPEIDWIKRITIQSIVQKYVTHSISSTINLPSDVSTDKVSEIYLKAWEMGLKGITVYRDGSRSGVLSALDAKKEIVFKETNAPKRLKRLKGDIHRFQNNLEKWVAVVGLLDGRPYEIFTGKNENGLADMPNNIKECEIVKNIIEDSEGNRRKRYDIEYVDGNGQKHTHTGVNHAFNPEFWNYSKLISGVLRHGMHPIHVYKLVESLNLKDDNLNTWKNGVARTIKKYIKDGEKIKGKCDECGGEHLEFKEGCLVCMDCGSGKCS